MSNLAGSPQRGTADPGPLPDPDEPALRYPGLATRILSFTVDAALITLVAIIVSVGAALILTLLHFSKDHDAVLAIRHRNSNAIRAATSCSAPPISDSPDVSVGGVTAVVAGRGQRV